MKRFENKIVIITGAASGIGEAASFRIAAEGGKVIIADYSKEKADALAEKLRIEGYEAESIYFSAADLDSCQKLVELVTQKYNGVDVLVNNVGGTNLKRDSNVQQVDITYFDEAFHINLRCAIYLTQLVVPIMESRGGGNIVNIASVGGITADFRGIFYGASKAGLINMTKYTATQVGKKNIRCNAIAPGLILTPAALNNLPEKMRQVFVRHNSLPFLGKPEDVAAAIAFLASEDARYITGQTLIIDGGLTIHNPTVADVMELNNL